MTTISVSSTVAVRLTAASQNPVTVLAGGGVTTSYAAIYGTNAAYWTINNSGTLLGGGSTAAWRYGIGLVGGGAVSNATSALISGYGSGVLIDQTGTVVNNGTIIARGTAVPAYHYYVAPTPRITVLTGGVVLGGGGVTNMAGGTIAGGSVGIGLNGAGSIVNAGLVTASGGTRPAGIALGAADSVTNLAGGVISSAYTGILAANSGISVTNYGTIAGTGAIGVFVIAEGTVDNVSGLISGGAAGVAFTHGGYVRNGGTISANFAVYAGPTGTVVNTGDIAGGKYGVQLGHTGTIINSGIITNTATLADATVNLGNGGNLTNEATGTIAGHWIGVGIGNSTVVGTVESTIVNAGSIGAVDSLGNGADLWLRGAAYVRNTGVISGGPFGLVLYAATTVVNLGTITGGAVYNEGAIAPGNSANAATNVSLLLEEAPGAVLSGHVVAPVGTLGIAANTLELLSGATTGTISGFGTRYENFGNIVIDAAAHWLVAGTAQGLAAETISGLAGGNTLELTGTVESYGALAGGMLTLSGGTTLDLVGVTKADVTNDGTNTFITACFASGTTLLTTRGPVAVEALREGDLLPTASGIAPIRWIGHRRTALRGHPNPYDVMPVRIRAHAFGKDLPERDLVLSPDHAVLVDGVLVPIRHLVNGVTIAYEARDHVTYWHVELARHDIVLAEGLSCETYLDTGNRSAFENADGAVQLHPEFARAVWAKQGCAAILTDPADPALRRIHTRLLVRASGYGSSNSTSTGTWSEGCALARSSRSGAA